MKVLLCTKHDVVGSMMLNLILPRIAGEHSVQVILANRIRPEASAVPDLAMMKLFEQDLPAQLLFPLLDARASTESSSAGAAEPSTSGRWLSFEALARRFDVSIVRAGHIARTALLSEMVAAAAPDLIVSFQFGFIFGPEALSVPRLGALNLHSGALPVRAGVNPSFWCMKEGDRHTACTLHWMAAGIDSGPVVEVRPLELDYQRSFFANWMDNYRQGADMIAAAVMALGRGERLAAVPQDPAQLCFVPTPTQQDFRDFAAAGHRMIDAQDWLDLLARYLPMTPAGETESAAP